jgi:ribosomal protein S27AE
MDIQSFSTNFDTLSQNDREQVLQLAKETLQDDRQDEVALSIYSALAPRDEAWLRVVNRLVDLYPDNPLAGGWREYINVMQADHAGSKALLNELIEREAGLSTGNDLQSLVDAVSPYQRLAVVDVARRNYQANGEAISAVERMSETDMLTDLEASVKRAADAQSTGEGVYEMLWDCRFCGSAKLLGKTHRFCPSCGAAQDPGWRYFPADEDKVAVRDHHYVGADKICPACSTANSGDSEYCGRCGYPLSEAARAKKLGTREQVEGQAFAAEDIVARIDAKRDAAVGRGAEAQSAKGSNRRLFQGIAVLVILAVIGAVVAMGFWTRQETATVVDHYWERVVEIEELQAQSGSGDCDSMPSGAYGVDRRREQVDTRRVADGETCSNQQVDQGDGTFRQERVCETTYREEPVYGDVCYYTVNRWVETRSVDAVAGLDVAPYWPETDIRSACTSLGCEREGDQRERYVVVFSRQDEDEFECEMPYDEWESTPLDSTFTIEVGMVLGGSRCGSLERQ